MFVVSLFFVAALAADAGADAVVAAGVAALLVRQRELHGGGKRPGTVDERGQGCRR